MSVEEAGASTKSRNRRSAIGYQIGLVGFARLICLLRQIDHLRFAHPRYGLRVLLVIGTSLCAVPLRMWESVRFGRQIDRVRIDRPPVFIIGHWRSGTTHLHNLMSQDPAFGFMSMYQTLVPGCSLVGRGWLDSLLARIVPLRRPMDNMTWPMGAPQEDEIALAKMIPFSFYARFLFPALSEAMFDRYVLLNGAKAVIVDEVERAYYRLLQVATLHAGGRRLLLKNPVNTARVPLLLRSFPDAKFIHIYRCPYDVYPSTLHLHSRLLQVLTLQKWESKNRVEGVLQIYEKLMCRFFTDKVLIPLGNLVEVRYEDLERDPEGEVQRIYEGLGLPGYDTVVPKIRAYLGSVRSYRKNRFKLADNERRLIADRWGFAFDELRYPRTVDKPNAPSPVTDNAAAALTPLGG
jgi:hypothetical protein